MKLNWKFQGGVGYKANDHPWRIQDFKEEGMGHQRQSSVGILSPLRHIKVAQNFWKS